MTRFTWGIVIGVLVLVAVSVGLAIALPRTQPTPDLSTPDGVALAYALAMQRGEPEAAWELLSSAAQAQTTRDRFITRATGLTGGYERARLSVEDVSTEGDTARVRAGAHVLGLGRAVRAGRRRIQQLQSRAAGARERKLAHLDTAGRVRTGPGRP